MKKYTTICMLVLVSIMNIPAMAMWQDEEPGKEERRAERPRSNHFVNFELGLINYLTADSKFPDATDEIFTLKPVSSNSIGLTTLNRTKIAGPLFIDWAANITWNTYNFQDPKTRIDKDLPELFYLDNNNFDSYKKSKLNITYINAFFVPMIHTDPRSSDGGFRFGAGLFAGYRIGSNLKVKFDEERKQKDRIKSNFFLNSVQYGLRGQLGWKGTDFFVTYNMNTLFQNGHGPEVYPIGFGIIF